MNAGRMDLVVIQYCSMRVGVFEYDTWRMLVSDSNTCSCVRSLGIVGQERSSIVPVGASRAEKSGQRCGSVEDPYSLAP